MSIFCRRQGQRFALALAAAKDAHPIRVNPCESVSHFFQFSDPGRIANWTRWQLRILTKEQWQAVHTLTAVVFLVGGLFHLLKFNWKSFLIYLRKKAEAGQHLWYEMFSSLALFLLILAGTIAQQPPFQTIMAAGDSVRQSWEDPASVPTIPHMEEMTLREFAKNIQMEPDKLMQSLQTLGYSAAGQDEAGSQRILSSDFIGGSGHPQDWISRD